MYRTHFNYFFSSLSHPSSSIHVFFFPSFCFGTCLKYAMFTFLVWSWCIHITSASFFFFFPFSVSSLSLQLFIPFLFEKYVSLLPVIHLLFCSLCLLWVSYIKETKWYLSWCVWFISLTLWSLSTSIFLQMAQFYLSVWQNSTPLCINNHIFLISSSSYGQIECCQDISI